jgi:hypothetical protein
MFAWPLSDAQLGGVQVYEASMSSHGAQVLQSGMKYHWRVPTHLQIYLNG